MLARGCYAGGVTGAGFVQHISFITGLAIGPYSAVLPPYLVQTFEESNMSEQTSVLITAIAAILLMLALRYLERALKRATKKQNLDTYEW